jgi:hypothetical protein
MRPVIVIEVSHLAPSAHRSARDPCAGRGRDMSYRIKRAVWWVAMVVVLGYLASIPVIGWWQDAPTSSMVIMTVFWSSVLAVLAAINERHGFLRGPRDDC